MKKTHIRLIFLSLFLGTLSCLPADDISSHKAKSILTILPTRTTTVFYASFYAKQKECLRELLDMPISQIKPASYSDLIPLIPKDQAQARTFLCNLIENIGKQTKLMCIAHHIARGYTTSIQNNLINTQSSSNPKNKYTILQKNLEWFSSPTHTDPSIIALQLKYLSEWMKPDGEPSLRFSPSFLYDLHRSPFEQLRSIAEFAEALLPKAVDSSSKDINVLLHRLARKIFDKDNSVAFTEIPSILSQRQPICFSQKILANVTSMTLLKQTIVNSACAESIPNAETIGRLARSGLFFELTFMNTVQQYKDHEGSINMLTTELKRKLSELPTPSFIAHVIPKQRGPSASTKTSRTKKRTPTRSTDVQTLKPCMVAPHASSHSSSSSSSSSLDSLPHGVQTALTDKLAPLTKRTGILAAESSLCITACSSSSSSSSSDIAPLAMPKRTSRAPHADEITESTTMIRIKDANQKITVALFKPERPNAQPIRNYTKTHAMNLWLTDPNKALIELGYRDETHKNFTPSIMMHKRMEQYHGYTTKADSYVTQCGVTKEYRKLNGETHIMTCMPGAIYFADDSHQLGIFTYLIDPIKKQLYHRMFHECSGEKIIKEYQALGYWDIDPELA